MSRSGGSQGGDRSLYSHVVCQYGPGGNYTGQAPYGFSTGQCLDLDNDDVWQMNDADDTDRTVH